MAKKSPTLPEIFFDNRAGGYWLKHAGRFLNLDSRNCKLHMMSAGFYIDPENDYGLKAGDQVLVQSQKERYVDYAGPLSGHPIGPFETAAAQRILVTTEAHSIETGKKPDCPFIEKFFNELFGAEQMLYVLCWLKLALESLRMRDFRPGQLMALLGPSGCGKSLFQALVTKLLGGRSAKPYRYMIGETNFNSDLAGAEHLIIEDENSSADIRSRRKFGASIKEFTVNTEISVHAKGREAITLPTFKRLSLSANDEPENMMILPPMDNSILDKVMLIKCCVAKLSEDREKNWKRLVADLPGLVKFLQTMRIPFHARDTRFGVKAFHNPEIMDVVSAISPESRLEALIDEVLFEKDSVGSWNGSAEELEKALRSSSFNFAVERLLYFSSACGVYLSRLASKKPERYEQKKNKGRSVWTIKKGD